MKLWREWLLIMFFISSASSICKKVILADKEIIECNPFCRNIRDYAMAYFCESTSLDDLMAEFTHAAAEYRGDDIVEYNISLYITDTLINVLGLKAYKGPPLYHLSLHNTSTKKLLAGYFNNLASLKVLDITNNQIDTIIEGSLSALPSLQILNLSYNSISSIFPHSFTGLSELNNLNISHNKIVYIDGSAFSTVLKLKYLDLSHNSINTLGESLNNNNLLHLDLSYNQFEEFPFNRNNSVKPSRPKSLESLNIGHNLIKNLSSENLKNMTSLGVLNLSNNNLTFLPRALFISSFNLKQLDISSNRIFSISLGLFSSLQQLEFLDLSNNNMSLNLNAILLLRKLKILKLNGNNVRNFNIRLLSASLIYLEEFSLNDDMFSCKDLVTVLLELTAKNISVIHGNNTETDNILGISCFDTPDANNEVISVDRDNKVEKTSASSLERFLNIDFQNTTFYKFFENFHLPSYQDLPFVQYPNNNLSRASFYKLMESFRTSKNISFDLANVTNNLLQNIDRLNPENCSLSHSDFHMVFDGIKSLQQLLESIGKDIKEVAIINDNLSKLLISQNITGGYLSKYFERYNRNDIPSSSKFSGVINEKIYYESTIRKNIITTNVLLCFIFITILVFVLIVVYRQNIITFSNRQNLELV
ncbi:uncharacterized protein LOC143190107 [Rhynchophorus ferrugineus]|uniref:uncharacterized protein LOC143190107 n=1 Tax=Rhynchophorus ferrugineus TaxID=354439 RepID=UPI003FCDCEB7